MKKRNTSWKNKMYPIDYFIYAGFVLFMLITLFPFWYVLVGSFNLGTDYLSGGVWIFPRKWSLDNYIFILSDSRLLPAIWMTVLRTTIGTVTSVLFTAIVAYAMHLKELRYKKFFYWINIVTMFFGGGLIPFFLLIVNLGMYDSFAAYIVPGMYSVFNMLVFSAFFRAIPNGLRESAMMDGASEFKIMFKIYFPLALPAFATISLWTAVGHWNAYYDTMLYTVDPSLRTLQYYLMMIIKQSSLPPEMINVPSNIYERVVPQTISYAAIIIAIIPVLIMYPLIQKAYKKGSMIGALKE